MTTNPAAIVVGVDGSPSSLHALDWGTREAAVRHCPLRIVHAFRWPLTNELMGPPAAKALRDSRVFPIFEGSNDVLRAFVALSGLKTVADEFADLRHLNLTDPIGSIGVLADYVSQRVRRRMRPGRLDTAHPTLARHADRVAEQVGQLRATAEKLLRIHGHDIQLRQRQQKRLAHAVIVIYAQIATISRTTALFDQRGVEASGQERYISGTFCDRAAGRVAEQFDRVDDNDDTQTHAIARLAYNQGGYTHRLH